MTVHKSNTDRLKKAQSQKYRDKNIRTLNAMLSGQLKNVTKLWTRNPIIEQDRSGNSSGKHPRIKTTHNGCWAARTTRYGWTTLSDSELRDFLKASKISLLHFSKFTSTGIRCLHNGMKWVYSLLGKKL